MEDLNDAQVPLTDKRLLLLILITSLLAKVGTRWMLLDNTDYWQSGYSIYYQMADDFLRHGEVATGSFRAFRPPVYPMLIALVCKASNYSAHAFIVVQALISTVTVALVYGIATHLAGRKAGMFAAGLYAFYPYAFMHDTQLQETGLYTCVSTAAISCLLCALKQTKGWQFLVTGMLLGLAVLTRISHILPAVMIGVLVLWLLRVNWSQAVRLVGCLVLGSLIVLSPWLIRNKLVTGHAALTSETGFALARAHNEFTFQYYPWRSIDLSWARFHAQMDPQQQAQIAELTSDEFALSQWYRSTAWRYICQHPGETLLEGFYKVAVNFLGVLSPLGTPLKNWVFAISYWVLMGLTLVSLPVVWRTDFFRVLLVLLLAHCACSFVFWAHTSHRAFLDPLHAVMAGIGISLLLGRK